MKHIIIAAAILGSIAANATNNEKTETYAWEDTVTTQLNRIAEEAETELMNKIENSTVLVLQDTDIKPVNIGYATYEFEEYSTTTIWNTGESPVINQGASLLAMNI